MFLFVLLIVKSTLIAAMHDPIEALALYYWSSSCAAKHRSLSDMCRYCQMRPNPDGLVEHYVNQIGNKTKH